MKFSPFTFVSVFFIGLGILILISPDLLAYTVAFLLISIGISLMGWVRTKKTGRKGPFVEVKEKK
ncbi:MAG: DUF3096 domain-containing protein [Candidatus Gracilibacteria bacterium]|nr:DUF3096 domain-containing protein [Candidatus Gracilibacteria bacterium]